MTDREYREQVYAGVLGKLIGVFYGRPIEGWPYEKIRETFDVVDHYVYREAGTPLIVADDDLAGTFTFFNAVEDCEDVRKLTSRDMGETWLDYVIENKTIFWWGGLGRSTEHTAFLRLKQGMKAPESGSAKTNGVAVAEQIGAQIFMDAFAMMCPGDPEMARHLVKQAASVSHDGIAVESACMIAGMESMAFKERRIDRLIADSMKLGASDRMRRIVDDVCVKCAGTDDWRAVRQWLDGAYGYQLYPGNCHVIPNLALILVSLILGGDDFTKAMNLCVSSGWDTDCNGANLGCLNGIRLGLGAMEEHYDFRGPIADRMYQISSDGGACVSDAVIQTRRIVNGKKKLYGEKKEGQKERFSFELPGSVQGFSECPVLGKGSRAAVNGNTKEVGDGIFVEMTETEKIRAVSTPVMWLREDRQANYCLTGSPTLYEGQTVKGQVKVIEGSPKVRLYVVYYDFNSRMKARYCDDPVWSDEEQPVWRREGNRMEVSQGGGLEEGTCTVSWKIPSLNGQTIARIGMECSVQKGKGAVLLQKLHWDGAPKHLAIVGSQRNYDVPGLNMTMEAFVSSAAQYSFDSKATFVISHTEKNGVATTGTGEWKDYRVRSVLKPELHERFGLTARAKGHRRYYGLVFSGNRELKLIKRKGSEEIVLASCPFGYENNQLYETELTCSGSQITGRVSGRILLEAEDEEYRVGGAGYLVDCGTVLAYGFYIDSGEE